MFAKYVFRKLSLLLIIPFFSLHSQTYLGAGFGGTDFHISDLHSSPLIFGSIGIAPAVQFIQKGEKGIHNFELSYYNNYLPSSNSNFNTDSWRGRIQYSYVHLVSTSEIMNRTFNIYVGGSACTFFSKDVYYYYYKPVDANAIANVSWIWSHSIDLSAEADYNISEREFISAQIDMPLISNISRPEYSPSQDYNYTENAYKIKMFGTTEIFPNYFAMNLRLDYQRPLFWNFNMQVSYEFYYSFYNKPSEIKMYMNNFRGGLFYCF
jgi:hypothetical protein